MGRTDNRRRTTRPPIEVQVRGWQVAIVAATLLASVAVIGGSAAYVGHELGERDARAAESAPKIYTAQDLIDAATTCGAPADVVSGSTLFMGGNPYPGAVRQCVAITLDAPTLAITELFSTTGNPTKPPEDWTDRNVSGATYTWSNLTMTWVQQDYARDLTITVGAH